MAEDTPLPRPTLVPSDAPNMILDDLRPKPAVIGLSASKLAEQSLEAGARAEPQAAASAPPPIEPPQPPKGPGPGGPVAPSSVPDSNMRDLLRRFDAHAIHPVMIFGTSGSGKTVMLQSLLFDASAKHGNRLGVNLGDPVFPADYPQAAVRQENARKFFENGLVDFTNGALAGRTQMYEPFFVPVNLNVTKPDTEIETIRFAFLESLGEWYSREGEDSPQPKFRPLNSELASILKQYEKPISIIFVAPTRVGKSEREADIFHRCLANAMDNYAKYRSRPELDNILLIVSKWDTEHNPGSEAFGAASGKDVLAVVNRLKWVWPVFVNNIRGVRPEARALMPYAAAWIDESNTFKDQAEYGAIFKRFNETLWNWLYGNAKEVQSGAVPRLGAGRRAALFPDALPEEPPKLRVGWLGYIFTFLSRS